MAYRNKKGKLFTWSFSALSDYETCPKQYAAKRYFCTVKEEETEAMRHGTLVHKAFEDRLRDKTPLPEHLKKFEGFCLELEGMGGELHVEKQVAFSRSFELVDWFAKDAFGRGVFDVAVKKDKDLYILDWKTGKQEDNSLQLRIFAAFGSLVWPEVENFYTNYVWLKNHGTNAPLTTGEKFNKSEILPIWEEVAGLVKRIEEAWKHEQFPGYESGLCKGWCPVKECSYWQPKRK